MAFTDVVLYTASIHAASGIPRDYAVNTFHVGHTASPTADDLLQAADDIADFYNTAGTAPLPLCTFISDEMARGAGALTIKAYRLPHAAGLIGSPDMVRDYTLGAGDNQAGLPQQVAVVLSLKSDLTDVPEEEGVTRPAERRRGRLYFGPLQARCLGVAGGTGVQTVKAETRTSLANKATDLQHNIAVSGADTGAAWCIFSRKDWTGYPIIGGFVDDRFDTIRKRLPRSSTRTLWAAAVG